MGNYTNNIVQIIRLCQLANNIVNIFKFRKQNDTINRSFNKVYNIVLKFYLLWDIKNYLSGINVLANTQIITIST